MKVLLAVCCAHCVALLILSGCQQATPETAEPDNLVNAGHDKDLQEGVATRELDVKRAYDEIQTLRDIDLKVLWCGDSPGKARVFVDGLYVGRGRPGFVIAARNVDKLPTRGKIMITHGVPPIGKAGSSSFPGVPDPFSAWPDLGDAFLKILVEKEVCVDARVQFVGWEECEGEDQGHGVLGQVPLTTEAKENETPRDDSTDRHNPHSD